MCLGLSPEPEYSKRGGIRSVPPDATPLFHLNRPKKPMIPCLFHLFHLIQAIDLPWLASGKAVGVGENFHPGSIILYLRWNRWNSLGFIGFLPILQVELRWNRGGTGGTRKCQTPITACHRQSDDLNSRSLSLGRIFPRPLLYCI